MDKKPFPPFSLTRLLKTVFDPKPGERVAILIDLPDPRAIADFAFLKDGSLTIQRRAFDVFYQGLKNGGLAELQLTGGEIFAYLATGGSNLDLPATAFDPSGRELDLEREIYPRYNIFLCISTYSATAPLTAMARKHGFRGATLHGLNDIILQTGLCVDYNEVSRQAEKLRLGLTGADYFEIDFEALGQKHRLTLQCGGQEAQKSHGLCRGEKPDVANLPAGEVYFVPTSAEGAFPLRYEDGSIGLMTVAGGHVRKATLLKGRQSVIDEHNRKLQSDPATGEIGELGFGTQELPPSGRDIQDEKILGTLHVATGRSDHLGGHLTPDKFTNAKNATHEDILFSPTKTPEIRVTQARMFRGGKSEVVIENYQPSPYLRRLLAS
jgi:aminopeptidase